MKQGRQATVIDGHETWWAVCCENECQSVYIGPFFTLDACQEECNFEGCESQGRGRQPPTVPGTGAVVNAEHTAIAAVVDRLAGRLAYWHRLPPEDARQEAWTAALAEGLDGDIEGAIREALRQLGLRRQREWTRSFDYGWNQRADDVGDTLFEHVHGKHLAFVPSAEDSYLNPAAFPDEDEADLQSALQSVHPTIASLVVEVVSTGRNAYTVGREHGLRIDAVTRVLQAAGLTETGRVRNRRQGRPKGTLATVIGLAGMRP